MCHESAGSPGNGGTVGRAPAFVGVAVLGRRADRERRHLVEEEVQAVIVVDHHGDVGLHLGEPLAHGRVAVEERLPVRVVLRVRARSRSRSPGCARCRCRRRSAPCSAPRRPELRANSSTRHAGLLRADVLHVETENARELREVVDVAARLEQREHVAPAGSRRAARRSGRSACSRRLRPRRNASRFAASLNE